MPFLSPPRPNFTSGYNIQNDGSGRDTSAAGTPTGRLGLTRAISFPDDHIEPYIENESTHLKPSASALSQQPSYTGCPTRRDIRIGRGSYLSKTLLALSCYSTIMSMLWLVAAALQPRWGRAIYSGGSLTPSTASLLTALLAKTIELSFVTVFVGYLGQALSRRSIAKYSKGITIAEMIMRTWVIQPGYMITPWKTLRYVGWTLLATLSFVAALGAMHYTTASDAFVPPKLKFGRWENIEMLSQVRTPYANPQFVEDSCQTPITSGEDSQSSDSCRSIENAGQSKCKSVSIS